MKKYSIYLVIISLLMALSIGMCGVSSALENEVPLERIDTQEFKDNDMKLWYTYAGDEWRNEMLPIGNGNIGGMIHGYTDVEKVQVNEITLWGGGPNSGSDYTGGNTAGAYKNIESIREKLRQGQKNINAKSLTGNKIGWEGYQNVGDIQFDFDGDARTTSPTNYRRELDLKDGISRVYYENNGTQFSREYLASNPGNFMAINLKSSVDNKLGFTLSLLPDMSADTYNSVSKAVDMSVKDHVINCLGTIKSSKMKFGVSLKVVAPDATIVDNSDNTITVTDGEDVTVIMAIETNYDITENQNINNISDFHEADGRADYLDNKDADGKIALQQANDRVEKASKQKFIDIKNAHLADYQALFNTAKLHLGDEDKANIPTNQLLNQYKQGNENRYLENLLFQFGRYLLISSSRDSVLPANLQGLWNGSNRAPWGADYHFNVNLQMNYWPAFVTNIAKTADPLVSYIDSIMKPGNLTAREHFGVNDKDAWVVTTATTPLGFTGVGWDFYWGWTPGSAAWICDNLWDYYQYTQDPKVLDRIYPILKGASKFWEKFLVEDPQNKDALIAYPSTSSEHGPVSMFTTYDISLSKMLLQYTKKAANLKGETEYANSLQTYIDKLHPYEIGEDGQIKEWREECKYNRDKDGNQIGFFGHRHVSHLLGLHPGNLIKKTDPLIENAITSLELRGDGQGNDSGAGWGMSQRASLWARTGNGNKAHGQISRLLNISIGNNLFNQMAANKIFQIDGNFGATAGMAEMLIQSHEDKIEILPALPDKWATGSYEGLVARGNFVTDAEWKNGDVTKIVITSNSGNVCRLDATDVDGARIIANGKAVDYKVIAPDIIEFNTTAGTTYTIDQFPVKLPPVTGGEAHRMDNNSVYVSWDSLEGATSYNLYRYDAQGNITCIRENITSTIYKDTTATYDENIKYRYAVSGVLKGIIGKLSAPIDISSISSFVDNIDTRLKYSDGWLQADSYNAFDRTVSTTDAKLNSAEFSFIGTGIEYYGQLGANMSFVNVYIDGALKDTKNLYKEQTQDRQLVYSINELDYGKHSIKIEVGNDANTQGKYGVSLDYFHILNSESKMVDFIELKTDNGLTLLNKDRDYVQILSKVMPTNALTKTIEYRLTDLDGNATNLATINQDGLVKSTNRGSGYVKVWAVAKDGSNTTNTLVLTVVKKDNSIKTTNNVLKGAQVKLIEGSVLSDQYGAERLTDGIADDGIQSQNRFVLQKGLSSCVLEIPLQRTIEIDSVTINERWCRDGDKLWDDLYVSRVVVSVLVGEEWKVVANSKGLAEKVSNSMAERLIEFDKIATNSIRISIYADHLNDKCICLWEIQANGFIQNITLNKPVKLVEGKTLPNYGVNYITDGYYCSDGKDNNSNARCSLDAGVSKGVFEIDFQNFYKINEVRLLERWAQGWDELYINYANVQALIDGQWKVVCESNGYANKINLRYAERIMNFAPCVTSKIRVEVKVIGELKGNICIWEIESFCTSNNNGADKNELISLMDSVKDITSSDFTTGYDDFVLAYTNAVSVANDMFASQKLVDEAFTMLNNSLKKKN